MLRETLNIKAACCNYSSIFSGCYSNWVFPWEKYEGKSNLQCRILALALSTHGFIFFLLSFFLSSPLHPLLPRPFNFPSLSPPPAPSPHTYVGQQSVVWGPEGREEDPRILLGEGIGKRSDSGTATSSCGLFQTLKNTGKPATKKKDLKFLQ